MVNMHVITFIFFAMQLQIMKNCCAREFVKTIQ